MTPRWNDTDVFGHINNAEYYAFFDTAVMRFMLDCSALSIVGGSTGMVVAESGCRFHREIVFTDAVEVGLRIAHPGRSSVRYEIGVFKNGAAEAAAEGHFVHVFIDRDTMRPQPIPETIRAEMAKLVRG